MGYLSNSTYVSPTKEQIRMALTKVERMYEFYKPVVLRLQTDEVEVSSWFGLRKTVMSKDKHILKVNKNSFIPYHTRAYSMGYITLEEYKIFKFMMGAPTLNQLREWRDAERVYLGEFDYSELMFALTQEIE